MSDRSTAASSSPAPGGASRDREGPFSSPRRAAGASLVVVGNLTAIVAIFLPWAHLVTWHPNVPHDLEVGPLTVLRGAEAESLAPFCGAYPLLALGMATAGVLLLIRGGSPWWRRFALALGGVSSALALATALLLLYAHSLFSLSYPYYTTTLEYGVVVASAGAAIVLVGMTVFSNEISSLLGEWLKNWANW